MKITMNATRAAGSRVTEFHGPFKAEGTDIRNAFGVIVGAGLDEVHSTVFAAAPAMLAALEIAERFISGFEGDDMQEGIDANLAAVRAAIAAARGEG